MSETNPANDGRGPVDSRATDQPPGYSAPLTQAQKVSLIIPAVIFVIIAAVLIYGLSTSAASAPPTPGPIQPTAAPPTATEPAISALLLTPTAPPATATSVPPTATEPPTATSVPPTATEPPAPTSTPEPTATSTPEPAADKPLLGRRIALDPGHGPRHDLGAVYVDPDTNKLVLAEDEVNLDVAFRTKELLEERGAVVSMTRESQLEFSMPWPPDTNGDGKEGTVADDLQERIDIINLSKAEVFLSIHMNSHADPNKRQGIQVLYCATDDCPFAAANKRLGIDVIDQLVAKMEAIGYPVKQTELRNDMWTTDPNEPIGHLFMTGPAEPPNHPRGVEMPGVTAEALYITSPLEVEQLQKDEMRQAIALAYADALQQFLTEPPSTETPATATP